MPKERIYLWDNFKLLLMFFVILGHCADLAGDMHVMKTVFLYVYSFHMPAFLLVSGLFYKPDRVREKAAAYIMIGLLLKVGIFSIRHVFGSDIAFSLLSEKSIPWFMFSLAAYTVLCWLLRDQDRRAVLAMSILLACFAGYDKSLGDGLALSRTVVFFPFFYLGTMLRRERIEALVKKPWCKILGAAVILLWLALCILRFDALYPLRPLFTGRNSFNARFYPLGFLWRLLCCAISAAVSFAWLAVTPARRIPAVSAAGARTLQIYFWHMLPLFALKESGAMGALCATVPGKLAWLGLSVVLLAVFAWRPFAFPTELLAGGRGARPRK